MLKNINMVEARILFSYKASATKLLGQCDLLLPEDTLTFDLNMAKLEAIDLFCGVGGLTCGLQQANIKVLAGVDLDQTCRYPFETNNTSTFIHKSVKDVTGETLTPLYSEGAIKILAGCAPCQPFSTYSQGNRRASDDQWALLDEFQRLINEIEPDIITMENVPALLKHHVFEEFVSGLRDDNVATAKYSVDYKVVACDEYGLPQTRKRLVLLASKLGKISIKPPTYESKTVQDVIGRFKPIGSGEADPRDPMHRSAKLSALNLKRIRSSKPGGTWRDWPKDIISACHKKETGNGYVSVYGRMEWDKPSPTMTTQFFGYGNGRFGHPSQDRALTLREGAMLQSFPKSYEFVEKGSPIFMSKVGRLIGNAVPPLLGKLIGESIQMHLKTLSNHEDAIQP